VYFAHSITVTINHRAIDRNGDYQVTSSFQLGGCAISYASRTSAARGGGQESFERDTIRASTILFAPSDSDIRLDDTVTFPDGTTWHVWGLPTNFSSPFTGWQPGMTVPLRLLEG
jgi:hypothetical protein